jgi:hypothetical protein
MNSLNFIYDLVTLYAQSATLGVKIGKCKNFVVTVCANSSFSDEAFLIYRHQIFNVSQIKKPRPAPGFERNKYNV